MNVRRSAIVGAVSLVLLAACTGTRPSPPPAATSATQAPIPTEAAAPPTLAPIVVTLTDAMKIEPGTMTVPAGEPVTFVVTNVGKIPHEFTLGDADIQEEHEQEMIEMGGGMTHDEDNAISVAPGETKNLTFTFEMPGMSLAGCHVPGHYPAGMKATITIEG